MLLLDLYLPVLLYIAAIILLIVLIVLGIKMVNILDKVDRVIDNVEKKVDSLDTAFDIISKASNGLAVLGDNVVTTITSFISGIFNKKKIEEDNYE